MINFPNNERVSFFFFIIINFSDILNNNNKWVIYRFTYTLRNITIRKILQKQIYSFSLQNIL